MKSFSEIDTVVKRATKGVGFNWGVAEEVGKNIKLLELLSWQATIWMTYFSSYILFNEY